MLAAARIKCVPLTTFVSALARPAVQLTARNSIQKQSCLIWRTQGYATQSTRSTLRRVKTPTLKERLMAPTSGSAFNMGRGLVAGASVVGIASLCFYGIGLSNEVGAIDRVSIWPAVVKERIRDTYMYFGGSLLFTAGSAAAVLRSPRIMNLMMRNSFLSLIVTLGAMMGTGALCRSIPYQEGFGVKQLAWMLHTGVIGAVIAPLALMGGPLVIRAACYTAGVVGGLSTLAMCAPSEKFLNMGGPLCMGLGVVFVSSIGSSFLSPATALGAGLYSISIYGGLVLFGLFLLYDTQKIIKRAETHPILSYQPFDPINNSIGIYLDTINIFIRLLMILGGGGNRKR